MTGDNDMPPEQLKLAALESSIQTLANVVLGASDISTLLTKAVALGTAGGRAW